MRHKQHLKRNEGFTLIELLVVIVIIAILATVTLTSFLSYNKSQSLKNATLDVVAMLQDAKLRAQSQVKPDISSCNTNPLNGYEVRICGLTGSVCMTENTYELYVSCGGTKTRVAVKSLPANVIFDEDATTSTEYLFRVINAGVEGSGTIGITGFGSTLTISVNAQGAVSIQ